MGGSRRVWRPFRSAAPVVRPDLLSVGEFGFTPKQNP